MLRNSLAWLVCAAAVLSWLGEVVHNLADLPDLPVLSPENVVPGLLAAGLVLAWLIFEANGLVTGLLLAWAGINLIGGAISVLPLGFLPFYAEQTLKHYAFHVLYAGAQVPLICLLAVRRSR